MPKTLTLPAIKIVQPIGEFLISSIEPNDLVDISYSDVRRLADEMRDVERYLGIQRPISRTRIRAIREYVRNAPDATFPTAIILAIDERCAEYDEESGKLTLYPYEAEDGADDGSIEYSRIAKVLDGQHRIAGFMDEDNNCTFEALERTFQLNLAILIGADISEQASVFATVNLAQTKVNRSLVYDLTDLANAPSPYKASHNVAVALDGAKKSPLFERIKRLGVATPGRQYEPLTQATFVESLVKFISHEPQKDRNLLLDGKKIPKPSEQELQKCPFRNLFREGKEEDISVILYNYFKAVENKWPKAWGAIHVKGNLLPRSNAFKAFMKYLLEDVYLDIVKNDYGKIPNIAQFSGYFTHISLTDKDFTTKNFVPGSGGQSTFYKLLTNEISGKDLIAG